MGVDVAVLGLPGGGIRQAVAACVRREVGAALVFAAGFGETGEQGRAEQDAIAAIARDGGMALSGPQPFNQAVLAAVRQQAGEAR
jgi:acyl-CoA synthetase (NDP forming)